MTTTSKGSSNAKKTAKKAINKAKGTSEAVVAKKGFFEEVTFKYVVSAIATLVLAFTLMMTMLNNPLNHLRVSNEGLDIQARKAVSMEQEKTKQEQEKTKQAEIMAGRTASAILPSRASSLPSVRASSQLSCETVTKNGSYIVPDGRCITLDNTAGGLQSHAYSTYINVSRPVTEISGGDFVVISLSKSAPHEQCDSRESEDRCKKWIADHVHQWNGLYVARFRVMEGQKITIKT